ncbi:MAG TPA: hypothetical protein VGU72_04210 [Beijerinckiaceae bacterium]|jgi:hypothetical protein|nr:hypothetical protein [Beijerinckiaceae bacterium]
MLHEYAVEPQAIGSSWEIFRYVIEKFGFDRGRLISQFPKHWFKEVYQAADGLPPLQKKRIEEALNQAKKNKVVRSQRPYNPAAGDWLHNALAEHARSPFRAIIAAQNPVGSAAVLLADELDELLPLMTAPQDSAVVRDAASIATALQQLLWHGSRILFIDPFFDPYRAAYKSTLRECLSRVLAANPGAACEIHYRYHHDKPDNTHLEREAVKLFVGIIPAGMSVTIYCWRQKTGGADFHARYLLTDRGGIGIDAGFSAEGAHQTTDMHLMSFDLSQQRLASFARITTYYDLVAPVITVFADGKVTRS